MLTLSEEESPSFTLQNFNGPLELLLYLIQKHEIDIYDIPIQKITEQYLDHLKSLAELSVDAGGEFVRTTATIMQIKSMTLLPKKAAGEGEGEEPNPLFELLPQLLEYFQIKNLSKELSAREASQAAYYPRGVEPAPVSKDQPIGVDHVTIDELADYFSDALKKAAKRKGKIVDGEEWLVSDKILWVKELIQRVEKVPFHILFSEEHSPEELVVTFLALLELMKLGVVMVVKENDPVEFFLERNCLNNRNKEEDDTSDTGN